MGVAVLVRTAVVVDLFAWRHSVVGEMMNSRVRRPVNHAFSGGRLSAVLASHAISRKQASSSLILFISLRSV